MEPPLRHWTGLADPKTAMRWLSRMARAALAGRTKRVGAVVVGAFLAFATTGSGAAGWADPGPSARDIAQSKQTVRDRAAAVGRIKAKLAKADGELDHLATVAEVAVEHYNGQLVLLERARNEYAQAQQRLAAAQANWAQTRRDVAVFAAQAYRLNGGLSGLSAAIGGAGGPQGFLDRQSMIQVLADRQAGAIQRMQAAKQVADVFRKQTAAALHTQQVAARGADEAKLVAEGAVASQRAAVQAIQAQKAQLENQLGQAQAKADELQRLRAAALEAAREAAAAKAARAATSGRLPTGLVSDSSRGAIAVRAALNWLGTPYSWGGGDVSGPTYGVAQGADTRGFDCSGLVLYAWSKAGIQLDHWTGTQWTSGPHVPTDLLRPGDLVFFATDTSNPDTIHHVGMYIGDGQMIEAPYTGAKVRISSIWRNDLIGATRPLG